MKTSILDNASYYKSYVVVLIKKNGNFTHNDIMSHTSLESILEPITEDAPAWSKCLKIMSDEIIILNKGECLSGKFESTDPSELYCGLTITRVF